MFSKNNGNAHIQTRYPCHFLSLHIKLDWYQPWLLASRLSHSIGLFRPADGSETASPLPICQWHSWRFRWDPRILKLQHLFPSFLVEKWCPWKKSFTGRFNGEADGVSQLATFSSWNKLLNQHINTRSHDVLYICTPERTSPVSPHSQHNPRVLKTSICWVKNSRIVINKEDYFGMAADGLRNFDLWNVAHVVPLAES